MYNHEPKASNYLFNTTRTVMVKIRITYEPTNYFRALPKIVVLFTLRTFKIYQYLTRAVVFFVYNLTVLKEGLKHIAMFELRTLPVLHVQIKFQSFYKLRRIVPPSSVLVT